MQKDLFPQPQKDDKKEIKECQRCVFWASREQELENMGVCEHPQIVADYHPHAFWMCCNDGCTQWM